MRVLELPRWKIIKKEVLFSLLIWLYIFEDITLYMSGPKIVDQLFRIGCIAVMMGILLVRQKNGIPIRVDDVTIYGLLLIFSSVWQDLVLWNTVGIRIAINYVLPVFMYIFIINVWYYNANVSKVILGIPMVYGIYASIQGILLFLLYFFDIRVYS